VRSSPPGAVVDAVTDAVSVEVGIQSQEGEVDVPVVLL